MEIIVTIFIGLIVGLIARLIHPGRNRLGLILTALLGISGSVLATWAGQLLGIYRAGEVAGFVGAVVGAVVILLVVTRLRR